METQNIPDDQSNLKKEEQWWRCRAPSFQTMLQNHSKPNSAGLEQNQKHRSVVQYREPRKEPTLILVINQQEKEAKIYNGKRAFSLTVLIKLNN